MFGGDEVGRYRSNKPELISRELLQLLRLAPADAILVDDDEDNCRAVRLLGVYAVHVRDKHGMGEAELAHVLARMAGAVAGEARADGGCATSNGPVASA